MNSDSEGLAQYQSKSGVHGKRILVVDDDVETCELARRILATAGHVVQTALSGQECLDLYDTLQPNLIILDVRMPGMDGIAVCRQIRRFSRIPIVFLSAYGDEDTVLRGFDCGAIDFITKPFNARILLARVQSALQVGDLIDATRAPQSYKDSYLEVDVSTRRVTIRGEPVHLTALESDVLLHLIRHAGRPCSIQELLESVWGGGHQSATGHVYTYIRRVRRKLERDPQMPEYIVNIHGVGYQFSPKWSAT